MYLCRILNGVVVNRAFFAGSVPDGWVPASQTWVASDEAQIGWAYDGSTFTPPPTPPAPPPDNYKPMIRRRADKMEAAGDALGALKLRLSIGDL